MSKNTAIPGHSRSTLTLTKTHKLSIAGVATLGAAALAFSLVPASASADSQDVSAAPVAFSLLQSSQQVKDVHAGVTDQLAGADQKVKVAADLKTQSDEAAKKEADVAAKAEQAKADANASRQQTNDASRSVSARAVSYTNNLDGWIRESLDIMKQQGIPGSYDGLHRNIMRESSGNPRAINNWDINAQNGIPSKGLLQVIPPTFKTYHVPGTPNDIYDPVANITAAANYAADRYGSIDNVFSAY
ncbi:transglycosylase SLT domain-containing protein [Streptomyces sp. NPDC058001]|uniref:transglycosylase SLT domain-containing protein n=1 Tax=Streptomyces sp. NPDC058001 TaxID=3346300 RepID=UPI0036E373A1